MGKAPQKLLQTLRGYSHDVIAINPFHKSSWRCRNLLPKKVLTSPVTHRQIKICHFTKYKNKPPKATKTVTLGGIFYSLITIGSPSSRIAVGETGVALSFASADRGA